MVKNYWSSFKDIYAAAWVIEFEGHAEKKLVELLHGIVETGYDDKLIRLRSITRNNCILSKKEALALLNDLNAESSYLKVFRSKDYTYETKVHYYSNDGRIVYEWISDIGELLNRLQSPSQERKYNRYIYSNKAIEIDEPNTYEGKTWVLLTLPSDIWMPKIVDFRQIDGGELDLKDNKELCHKNSVRLNHFLSEIFYLAKGLGGGIRVEEDIMHAFYIPMVSENGLQLE